LTTNRTLIVGALVLAAALRFWSIDFGFPGKFRPDEGYLVYKGYLTLSGIFDPNFFIYPSLYIYTLGLIMFVTQTLGQLLGAFDGQPFTAFVQNHEMVPIYQLARLTTAAIGVVGVYLTYVLGRDAFGRSVGLLGAFLLAVNFSHARESHFATTDIAVTALATLTLWRLLFLSQRDDWRDYLIVGALTGLAVSTKYTAVALGLPCLIAHLMRLFANRGNWTAPLLWGRPLAALGVGVLAFSATSPFVYINSGKFWKDIAYIRRYSGEGETGVAGDRMSAGWDWVFGFGLRYAAGYVLGALIIAGILYALYVGCRRQAPLRVLLFPAFIIAVLALYLSGEVLMFRYMAILMPVSCLLAANVTWAAGERFVGGRRGMLVVCIVLAIAAYNPLQRLIASNQLSGQVDTRQLARQWIESNVPAQDALVIRGRLKYSRPQLPNREFVDFRQFERARRMNRRRYDTAWVIVDRHEIAAYSPPPPPPIERILEEEGRIVATFSPFRNGDSGEAVFDQSDAFYLPVAGFEAMVRPGPEIAIYRVEKSGKR
jgi:hypothetical protein